MGLPRWFWWISAATLFAASLPYLFALAIQPEGTLYLGVHSNYDDHAVYASWTKQAQEGEVFFENRFTTDEQAGKTIHLYFLAAGWLAKAVGIPIALHAFRVVFGFLALVALYRLLEGFIEDDRARATAFLLGIVSAGVGFAMWRNYGFAGPIDVWQPEAFVFPMLMQNGLFCAALWLILVVWKRILDARDSWKPVALGAAALLVLTNIHTYDTLLLAIVGFGLLAAMIGAGTFTWAWLARVAVIGCGALPAVAWFVYVRGIDPVFAARAETETISAPIWWVVAGLIPALFVSAVGLAQGGDKRAVLGAGLLAAAIAALQRSQYRMDQIWASVPLWAGLAVIAALLCWLYRPKSPLYGLLFAWIVMGLVALYYPGLFQRKLAIALALPVGVAAGIGLCGIDALKIRSATIVAGLAGLILGASSLMWLARESSMATKNISNTTMHRVYWPSEAREYIGYFRSNAKEGDAVIAMPGIAVPDDFEKPREYALAIPDLNAILAGWGGVKTFIGHWSETPDYVERRGRVMSDLFSAKTTYETAYMLMQEAGANYILAPTGDIARQAGVPPRDFYAGLGEVVLEGNEFILVRFRPSP